MRKGFNTHPLWIDDIYVPSQTGFVAYLDIAAAAGAHSIRYDVNWQHIRPDAIRDLSSLLIARNMTGLACLCGTGTNWPQPDLWAYARAAHELAMLLPEDHGIEVWNEPNVVPLFMPTRDPQFYAELAYVACSAIKQARPRLKTVVGAVAFDEPDFIDAVLAMAPRIAFDALSIHPYTSDGVRPESRSATPSFIETVEHMRDRSPLYTNLIISEVGWKTNEDERSAGFYRTAVNIARRLGVSEFSAYHLGDHPAEASENRLVDEHHQPTRSFLAFMEA